MHITESEKLITRLKNIEQSAKSNGRSQTLLNIAPTDIHNISVTSILNRFNQSLHSAFYHLKKHKINYQGITTIEPMPDGLPKAFVMIFADPKHDDHLKTIFDFCFGLSEFNVALITEQTPHPQFTKEDCERARAWASIHGIRRYRFFGNIHD